MNTWNYASPLGNLLLAEEDGFLTGLWMEGQRYAPEDSSGWKRQLTPVLRDACRWLDRYFAGERPSPEELPLAPRGSAFRKEVWQILCRIPYGQTVTYAAIAREIAGKRGTGNMSAQAVGGAVGHNPISIIIPCHRVLGSDGSLTGYAGGTERKAQLLALEGTAFRKEP